MRTVLVTGATGNVGRQLVAQLCAADVRVVALARNPGSASLPSEVEVLRGDLTDAATLDGRFDGVDAIFLMWQAPPASIVPALERLTKRSAALRRVRSSIGRSTTPRTFGRNRACDCQR